MNRPTYSPTRLAAALLLAWLTLHAVAGLGRNVTPTVREQRAWTVECQARTGNQCRP